MSFAYSLLDCGLSYHFLMLFVFCCGGGIFCLFFVLFCYLVLQYYSSRGCVAGWLKNIFSQFIVSLFISPIKVFYKEKVLSFSKAPSITWILLFGLNPRFQKFLLHCKRQPKKEVCCSVIGKAGSNPVVWFHCCAAFHTQKTTSSGAMLPLISQCCTR